MPWKQRCAVSERSDFVLRAVAPGRGETFKQLCEEFGVSRKTGYKWMKRYEEGGPAALENMSRRPQVSPLETSAEMAVEVVRLRRERPNWGRKKLHAVLMRQFPGRTDVPSERTVGRILDRAGEPKKKRKTRLRLSREAPSVVVEAPNDLWTVDFKGWWRTGDGERCEPLTVRDAFSRYVLATELLENGTTEAVRDACIELFKQHGLPKAIQCDNGSPFGSVRARGGLTRLSAWWLSLGIDVVFSRPGCPQDNGGHERMHLDISIDVEEHAAADRREQQRALGIWRHDFNHHRPHQALDQRTPAEVYRPSERKYGYLPRIPVYPPTWLTRKVSAPGRVHVGGRAYYIGAALIGQAVGLEPVDEDTVRVWFYNRDLGIVDLANPTIASRKVCRHWGSPHLQAAK